MNWASRPFRASQIALLIDPEKAALYLEEALAAGDMAAFKLAVQNVAEAQLGGITALTPSRGGWSVFKKNGEAALA